MTVPLELASMSGKEMAWQIGKFFSIIDAELGREKLVVTSVAAIR